MKCNTAIILAAGAGTRMKSSKPKVLHEVSGKSMVNHVIEQVRKAGAKNIIVVVGHGAELVKGALENEDVSFAVQEQQLGTGHAVMQASDLIDDEGNVLVLCADTPLITAKSLTALADYHAENNNAVTVLTANVDNPFGYGRIVRDDDGRFEKIVEEKDACDEEKKICEINSGMYCYKAEFLKEYLNKLTNDNSQKEYYITDLIEMAVRDKLGAGGFAIEDNREIMGVNNRVQLSEAQKIMNRRIAERHMMNGVTVMNPDDVYIEDDVVIRNDTEVWSGAVIKGKTVIGSGCVIGKDTIIEDSIIGDRVDILKSVIKESKVGSDTTVGPFAYLRPKTQVGNECRVGDFVEMKNAIFGDGSKASHLSYIGDADVGENVNVGCGVVFSNYDGVNKFRSTVGDRAFIGSNVNLIAPVTLEDDAYVAAGTTVTVTVPEGSLCVGRSHEILEEGWVEKKGLSRKK